MTGIKGMKGGGGKREGAGRPKGKPTKTRTFRIDAEALDKADEIHGPELNKTVNEIFINELSKPKKRKPKKDT